MGCLGGSTDQVTQDPTYFGPYGTGVQPQGQTNADAISKASQDPFAQSQAIAQNTAATATQNAASPVYGAANGLYENEVQGDYLNGNPALTKQLQATQQQANQSAGNQVAQIKGADQRAGMQFSTADQEAQQGAQAQQNATAQETNAGAINQNYQNERQIQNQAPQLANQNQANQLNMGQAGISALYSPLTAAANLNTGLYSGGSVATPNTALIQQPGALDYLTQILGAL